MPSLRIGGWAHPGDAPTALPDGVAARSVFVADIPAAMTDDRLHPVLAGLAAEARQEDDGDDSVIACLFGCQYGRARYAFCMYAAPAFRDAAVASAGDDGQVRVPGGRLAVRGADAMPRQAAQLVAALLPMATGPRRGAGAGPQGAAAAAEERARWPYVSALEASATGPAPFLAALEAAADDDWETDDDEDGSGDDEEHDETVYMMVDTDSDDDGEAVTREQLDECTVTFPIGELGRLAEDNRQCIVCQDAFETGEQVRALPCLHLFHPDCIDQWLCRPRSLRRCPRCMTDCITGTARSARIAGEKDEEEEADEWETVSGGSSEPGDDAGDAAPPPTPPPERAGPTATPPAPPSDRASSLGYESAAGVPAALDIGARHRPAAAAAATSAPAAGLPATTTACGA